MSSKTYAMTGKKPMGFTNADFPVYDAGRDSYYEEVTHAAAITNINPVSGSVVRIDVRSSLNERYIQDELYLEFTVQNSSATESPTFRNIWSILSAIELKFKSNKIDYCDNTEEILVRVQDHLAQYGRDLVVELNKCRTETTTYTGENAPVSSSALFVSLPLSWIFGILYRLKFPTNGIDEMSIQVTFQRDFGTAQDNGLYVTSNTTSNAYGTNLSFLNVQCRQCLVRPSDPAMYALVSPRYLRIASQRVQFENFNMTTASSNILQRVNLRLDFANRSLVRRLFVAVNPKTLRTAYNDADNCTWISGFSAIGFYVQTNGKRMVDYTGTDAGTTQRLKKYQLAVHEKYYDNEPPLEYVTRSDALSTVIMPFQTQIDLAGMLTCWEQHETLVAGVSTNANIEIGFTVRSATAGLTGGQLNLLLEYVDVIEWDGKSNYNLVTNKL